MVNVIFFLQQRLRMIPPTSIKRHEQIATEAPKHERIVCSDAANSRNDDFGRSAYIIYDTPDKAAKAVQKLNKMRIYQTPKPKSENYCFCSIEQRVTQVTIPSVCQDDTAATKCLSVNATID